MFRLLIATVAVLSLSAADWPEWRGPNRDGRSDEKGLPEKWDLAWKVPYGGRSAPLVVGNRVYLQNTAGKGPTEQERVMCFDADTGKVIWEYKFNVFQSDVPAHRVGWSAPAVDPTTGTVYVYGVGGPLLALSKEGKLLWERSFTEEFALFTTHGGRTVSPIIDGDLVIVSGPTSTWGTQSNRSHRFYGVDKKTGMIVWVSTPGGRPYDTTYSMPIIANVNGTRLLIAGAGDGAVHALKPQTGEPVWRYDMAKRGINTAVAMNGTTAFVSHSEENLDTNEMGQIAAVDATAKGKVGPDKIKWRHTGFQGGFSSPIVDGDRVLQIDNGSNLHAFDIVTGKLLWKQQLGTIQKASMVYADGKIYVGTETGKFYILKPHQDRCEILVDQALALDEQVIGSAAVSNGRVYFASMENLYAIGKTKKVTPNKPVEKLPAGEGAATWVQVVPTEVIAKPGDKIKFTARLFDAQGRFLRETKADWEIPGLDGTIAADGTMTVGSPKLGQAGLIKAKAESLTGEARIRIIPPMPWNETFDSYEVGKQPAAWVSTTAGKFSVQELEGNKVFAKAPDETLFKRMRVFFGPYDWHDYTMEADIRMTERRRQMGDAGIVAQRYALMIFGSQGTLELQPWQPETQRTVRIPMEWKKDTWYRLKLRVENAKDNKTAKVQGKVWVASEPEPEKWTIEMTDQTPNLKGAAGLFADTQFGSYYDNIKIYPNK
jgi:outer membrane protein assembly factor BamB